MNNVTSWQHIPEAMADAPAYPQQVQEPRCSVVGGVVSMNMGNDKAYSEKTTIRALEADVAPRQTGIISTAQNNAGMYTARITPESTVVIPGLGRTTVKVAEHLGYISRGTNGQYVEGSLAGKPVEPSRGGNLEGSTNESQDIPESASDAGDGVELFAKVDEEYYASLIQDIPQPVYDSLMASGGSMVFEAGGSVESISQKLGARLSAATGEEPDIAQAMVEEGISIWQDQADGIAKSLGAEPAHFYEWAMENRKGDLQKAVQEHVLTRNTKAYRDLLDAYFLDTVPTDEAFKAGGIPTKTQGGQRMVLLKGQWMTVEAAVKARLV